MAGKAAMYGGFTGLLPIGWIVLNIIFLQQLAEQNGSFKILQDSLSGITDDRRLQLLLIAFCFGAFFEGAAGFGTPVAVTAGILIGLGFSPLAASGLSPDCQHRAGGLWRAGHAGHHAGQGARLRPDGSHRHDRPPAAVLLAAGAVLADLGLCRSQGDDGNLAGHSGHRPVVCHSAVPGVELHRPGAGGHHCRDRVDGLPDPVPARLAAEEDLDLALAQGSRDRRRRSQGAGTPS